MPIFADVKKPILCECVPKPLNWSCSDLINLHHSDTDDVDLKKKYLDAINGDCPYKKICKRYNRALLKLNLQLEFPF